MPVEATAGAHSIVFAPPERVYAWRHVVSIFGSIYLLLAIGYLLATYAGGLWLALAVMPILGAQVYKTTIVMHDACHFSLFIDRRLNSQIGTFAGWLVGTDFNNFRRLHWRHHARYGEDDDPQGDDYLHLERASRGHLIWHVMRPLLGYNLFKLLAFGRAVNAETINGTAANTSWRDRFGFFVGVGTVQVSLAATATGLFQEPWLVLLYPVTAATFALFCSQTRGMAEHIAMPGTSPVNHARTHLPNWFDRLFFYTLNFNYHIEHHKYPSAPSCHLPELHARMRNEPGYGECAPTILGTLARRVQQAR